MDAKQGKGLIERISKIEKRLDELEKVWNNFCDKWKKYTEQDQKDKK